MSSTTPIERAVSTYRDDWPKVTVDTDGYASVNPETLANSTCSDFTFRYIDISSVTKGAIDWDAVERVRFVESPSRARRVLRHGDVLMCTVRPLLESHTYADWIDAEPTVCSTGFAVIRAKAGLLSDFLKYLPFAEQVKRQLIAWQCGTNYPAVNERDIRHLLVPAPKVDEQAAIASVLRAVDGAIEHTSIAVEQALTMRRALMQAAFNCEMTSEPRKNTDAGTIGQSWDALKGKQAFSVITGGNSSVYALKPLRGSEVANAWFMKVSDFNLPENARGIARTKIGFVAGNNPSFRLLPIGTIIIAKRGEAIMKNRVRTTAVPVALDPNLMALKVRDDICPEFFRYQLEWRKLARYVESSGVPQLNNKDLYPRWFVRAPEDQQNEIVTVLSTAERREDALRDKLLTLETLKKSLIHDLLTGVVRVDPTLFNWEEKPS
jgi:type I restriction enzyme, S subunit